MQLAIILILIGIVLLWIGSKCPREEEVKKKLEFDREWYEIYKEQAESLGLEMAHCGQYVLIEKKGWPPFACTTNNETCAYLHGFHTGKGK